MDTEAASFHKYHDRIYLVQLSTRADTAILDPLALTDLTPLGLLLADRAVEKVFHDADYDLRILDRDYGFRAANLSDTRIAAQLSGEPAIGLAALLEKYVGVKVAKEHQKADWSQRPLPADMLAYAAADTRHLPALRDALLARLRELGRLAWAQEEFERLGALRWTGASAHRWRDELAARQDKASFRIIGNDALLAVSRALPRTRAALTQTPGLPATLAARHEAALLEAVGRAFALADDALPRIERAARTPRDPDLDGRVERLKAVRNRVAAELALDPGVVCGRVALEAVARARPKDRAGLALVDGLRRWQIEVLGDGLLAALS